MQKTKARAILILLAICSISAVAPAAFTVYDQTVAVGATTYVGIENDVDGADLSNFFVSLVGDAAEWDGTKIIYCPPVPCDCISDYGAFYYGDAMGTGELFWYIILSGPCVEKYGDCRRETRFVFIADLAYTETTVLAVHSPWRSERPVGPSGLKTTVAGRRGPPPRPSAPTPTPRATRRLWSAAGGAPPLPWSRGDDSTPPRSSRPTTRRSNASRGQSTFC